jgi:hypothetical protein
LCPIAQVNQGQGILTEGKGSVRLTTFYQLFRSATFPTETIFFFQNNLNVEVNGTELFFSQNNLNVEVNGTEPFPLSKRSLAKTNAVLVAIAKNTFSMYTSPYRNSKVSQTGTPC